MRSSIVVVLGLAACGDGHRLAADSSIGDDAPSSDASSDAAPPPLIQLESASDLGVVPANVAAYYSTFEFTNISGRDLQIVLAISGPFSLDGSVCSDTLPTGAGCTLHLHPTTSALGSISGTLTITANGTPYIVQVSAVAEGYVSVAVTGNGTVSQTAGTACFGGACYLDGTQVTLTATAAAGSHFVAWSDSACGAGSTCVVTASATPHDLGAVFGPDLGTFDVIYDGNGYGQVLVDDGQAQTICDGSCSVMVNVNNPINLGATTPVELVGFGAPCPAGSGCSLPAGSTSIHVTFNRLPGEVSLEGDIVRFDGLNDTLIVRPDGFTLFDPTMAPIWSSTATNATVGPAGDVFVLVGSNVSKFDRTGALQWTKPAPSTVVAPTSVGVYFQTAGDTWQLFDTAGNPVTTVMAAKPPRCWTTTPDGHLYVGVPADTDPGSIGFEVFDASGTRQPDETRVMADAVECAMASDWTSKVLITTSLSGGDLLEVFRDATGDGIASVPGSASSATLIGVGGNMAGDMTWIAPIHIDNPPTGVRVLRVTAAGTVTGTLVERNIQAGGTGSGPSPRAVRVAPDGRFVVEESFLDFRGTTRIFSELFPGP